MHIVAPVPKSLIDVINWVILGFQGGWGPVLCRMLSGTRAVRDVVRKPVLCGMCGRGTRAVQDVVGDTLDHKMSHTNSPKCPNIKTTLRAAHWRVRNMCESKRPDQYRCSKVIRRGDLCRHLSQYHVAIVRPRAARYDEFPPATATVHISYLATLLWYTALASSRTTLKF